jgi:hypothetical protein
MPWWRRILWVIFVLPLLVLTGATREDDWREKALVAALQISLVVAAFAGFVWGVEPVFRLQAWIVVTLATLAVTLIGGFGSLLLLTAIAGLFVMTFLVCAGRRTIATVVSDTSPSCNPKFQFTDDNGQTHLVNKAVASIGRAYHSGQQVALIYWARRPNWFVVNRFSDKWGPFIFLLCLGVLLVGPCVAVVFSLDQVFSVRPDLFGAGICFLVGGIFSACGFIAAIKALRFRGRAAQAVGIIVESKEGGIRGTAEQRRQEGYKILTELPAPERGDALHWEITVEFEDAAGTTRRGTAEVSKSYGSRAYELGEQVSILYDPQCPAEVRTRSFFNWFGPLAVAVFGTLILAAGVFLWSGGFR